MDLEDGYTDDRTDDEKIRGLIKSFRFLVKIADDDWDIPYSPFNPNEFGDVFAYVEHQLWAIQKAGLLKFLDEDEFSNKEELYDKAQKYLKALNLKEQDAVLEAKLSAVGSDKSADGDQQQEAVLRPAIVPVSLGGPVLSDVLSKFIAHFSIDEELTNNLKKEASHFQFLIDVVGDKKLTSFLKEDVSTFLTALESKKRKVRGVSQVISATTKNGYIGSCFRVFSFAEARISGAPANFFEKKFIRNIRKPSGSDDSSKRKEFTRDELKKLFGLREHTHGEFQHPYQYWLPLLALYTGCRLNELCQLHLSDIVLLEDVKVGSESEEIWCISHNLKTSDKKSKSGKEYEIPIHPHLVGLGFIEFVQLLSQTKYKFVDDNGYERLFTGLSLNPGGRGYYKNASRWFNQCSNRKEKSGFKDRAGISSKPNEMLDFHSFRHTFGTEMQNLPISSDLSYAITGHAKDGAIQKGNAGDVYRHGPSISTKYGAIRQLDFSEELKNVKPFFDVCDKKRLVTKVKLKKNASKSKNS